MLTGWFPMWTATFDARRIVSLGLLRAFPLVLLDAATEVGHIEGVTIDVDRFACQVMCTCTLNDDIDAARYVDWYLVPDVDARRIVDSGNVLTVAGNLIGGTLVPNPSWLTHRPVLIVESPAL